MSQSSKHPPLLYSNNFLKCHKQTNPTTLPYFFNLRSSAKPWSTNAKHRINLCHTGVSTAATNTFKIIYQQHSSGSSGLMVMLVEIYYTWVVISISLGSNPITPCVAFNAHQDCWYISSNTNLHSNKLTISTSLSLPAFCAKSQIFRSIQIILTTNILLIFQLYICDKQQKTNEQQIQAIKF